MACLIPLNRVLRQHPPDPSQIVLHSMLDLCEHHLNFFPRRFDQEHH